MLICLTSRPCNGPSPQTTRASATSASGPVPSRGDCAGPVFGGGV
ncbi:hypothetical protein ACFQ9X_51535 [Catenulispora yoronensis]